MPDKNDKPKDLRDLRGKIRFSRGYDHKASPLNIKGVKTSKIPLENILAAIKERREYNSKQGDLGKPNQSGT
jgi:hypothetical protein